jgi:hypothetical protein
MSIHEIHGWVVVCDGCGYTITENEDPDYPGQTRVVAVADQRTAESASEESFVFVEPTLCGPCAATRPDLLGQATRAGHYFRSEFMVDDEPPLDGAW